MFTKQNLQTFDKERDEMHSVFKWRIELIVGFEHLISACATDRNAGGVHGSRTSSSTEESRS